METHTHVICACIFMRVCVCVCVYVAQSLSHVRVYLYVSVCVCVFLCVCVRVRVVAQSLSHGQLSVTPWTAASRAPLSFTVFQSLLKLMSIESVMPSNNLIFCDSPPFLNLSQHQGSDMQSL